MQQYTRLFDILYYQQVNRPQQVCLAGKQNGSWKTYSTQQVIDTVNKVSKCLWDLGIRKGDKVAIISTNRPEWNFIDLGALQLGAVDVPIYPTISKESFKYIFNDSTVKYCFVEDENLYNKAKAVINEVESLQEIYTFEQVVGAKHWTEILPSELTAEDIAMLEKAKAAVTENDLATLIYTSGTTGLPKGVMLSHSNIASNVRAANQALPLQLADRTLSFLPLCHIFERMVCYTYLSLGTSIYYAESLETIGENLKEVKPQAFTTVPRLLEKVYEKIMAKGDALTGFKRSLFFWAMEVGAQYKIDTNQGFIYNTKLAIARKLIFSKWHEALGGEVMAIVTGAAAMQPRLITLFTAAGIPVIEGYGLSETSPVLACNRFEEKDRRAGTVGLPISGVQIKIADDGEILAKGPNIMQGYYNKPEKTQEVMDTDGWFHTGDIGEFVEGRFLKITDRKKELFKTSGGKYVAPQAVENKMKESRFIEQLATIGNNKKFVSALIVPSFAYLKEWCNENNITFGNNASVVKNKSVIAAIQKEVNRLNESLDHIEKIKKFTLVPDEWSVDTEELTPTMKLKRRVIYDKYKNEIDAMYAV